MTPIPEVAIVKITPVRETRLVVVVCPYCSRRHVHGWPHDSPNAAPGLRGSHCLRGVRGSYRIVAPEGGTS